MRYLKTFSTCLVALSLHSAAWAQIYETTDAAGNPDFTDSPPDADAEKVNLPETNLANVPQPEPQEKSQPELVESGPAPVQENNTVIIHNDNDNDGYDDDLADDELARRRAAERLDPGTPGAIRDSEAQMPHEVGDSEAQMPGEVGDNPEAAEVHRGTEAHRR